MAKLNKVTSETIHFFLIEISQQLLQVEHFFLHPSKILAAQLFGRSGYSANLCYRVQNAVGNELREEKEERTRFRLKAVELFAQETHSLIQLARQSVKELSQPTQLNQNDYRLLQKIIPMQEHSSIIKQIRTEIESVEFILNESNSQKAIKLGKKCVSLQRRFQASFDRSLQNQTSIILNYAVTQALFSTSFIRQMLDVMKNISDTVLSISIGQKMNQHRYHSLSSVADEFEFDSTEIHIETVAETRSGSAISGIRRQNDSREKNSPYLAIFKEGEKKKLQEEREGVESWHDIYPGLAPKILAYHSRKKSASLLIEHLPGFTFESLIVNGNQTILNEAIDHLITTLENIWDETKTDNTASAQFIHQLRKRLPSIYAVHPKFDTQHSNICGISQRSFDERLKLAQAKEKNWQSPYSVYTHGDFNLDNIIYNPEEKRINFIDLHRSKYSDYAQDISVFMVSIYRLTILDKQRRSNMMKVAIYFFQSIRQSTHIQEDNTFELRIALGLIRSFTSSTRFILDPDLSKRMYLRANYLLDRVLEIELGQEHTFTIPLEDLFIE
ncbi:phosphotransferase [Marinomonas sp. 2405UD68-3]|uniref:phosphotransferase n=1 Tax=Marinomonas sp. 2405UD68-3 TaxID=3391835 RepID=UPI0039C9A023